MIPYIVCASRIVQLSSDVTHCRRREPGERGRRRKDMLDLYGRSGHSTRSVQRGIAGHEPKAGLCFGSLPPSLPHQVSRAMARYQGKNSCEGHCRGAELMCRVDYLSTVQAESSAAIDTLIVLASGHPNAKPWGHCICCNDKCIAYQHPIPVTDGQSVNGYDPFTCMIPKIITKSKEFV